MKTEKNSTSLKNRIICIIKRSKVKTCWVFVLSGLSSFVYNEKQSWIIIIIFIIRYKDFYGAKMSSEDTKILEFNQYQNSDETPSIIYLGLESLIKK